MEEDVTTYQEHRDICWKKLLQRIRKILEVSERSWKKDVTTYQKDLGRHLLEECKSLKKMYPKKTNGRRCYNVSGTSWKLLQDDVTTARSVRNILEVNILTLTGRSCYNVSEGCWKSLKKMFPRISNKKKTCLLL